MSVRYRWFAEDEDKKDDLGLPKSRIAVEEKPAAVKKPRYFSRTMITGMLLSIILLCYGLNKNDLPIVFLALAFISGGSRPLTELLPNGFGRSLSNLLFGFSVALFFGAIAMAFM